MSWVKRIYNVSENSLGLRISFLKALYSLNGLREECFTYVSGRKRLVKAIREFSLKISQSENEWREVRLSDVFCLSAQKIADIVFLLTVNYTYDYGEIRGKLKPDKYLLRLFFRETSIELSIKHLSGLNRTLEEDILSRIEHVVWRALGTQFYNSG
ncbi:MAG: hypothetical protein DRJ36_01990 [Thermoprotei archaeon]|nr:MAG: hypothetical protein DRJ36_01990 [Thermoprotei archaeon]